MAHLSASVDPRRLLRLAGASFAGTLLVAAAGAAPGRLASALAAEGARPERLVATAAAPPAREALAAAPAPGPVSLLPAPSPEPTGRPELDPPGLGLPGAAETLPWAPPTWFPDAEREELWVLDALGEAEGPARRDLRLRSQAVFVYDLGSGEVLLSRAADDLRPVASLTKLVSALALVSEPVDLDREVCLDASIRPSWPGAVSRLRPGSCVSGWDVLGAALVRSDNAAAYAFEALAGVADGPFVARMNRVAADLHMDESAFVGPAGVEDDNLSSARDMTRAVLAVAHHPVLAPVASAPYWEVPDRRGRIRRLFTTNRMAGQRRYEFLAAKTGYTDTARSCFSAVVQTAGGRTVALTTLGALRSRHRWSDVRRILDWIDRGVL